MNNNYTQVRIRIGMIFMIDGVKYQVSKISANMVACTSRNYGVSYMALEDLSSDFYNGNVTIIYGRKGCDLNEWVER